LGEESENEEAIGSTAQGDRNLPVKAANSEFLTHGHGPCGRLTVNILRGFNDTTDLNSGPVRLQEVSMRFSNLTVASVLAKDTVAPVCTDWARSPSGIIPCSMPSRQVVVADIVLEATHDILHAKVPSAKST